MPRSRYTELKQMLDERRRETAGRGSGQDARRPRRRHLGRQAERSARRRRELRGRHPGRHRVRAHPDEVRDAEQDQRRADAARAGQLRQLLRLRRGNRREAAARAAVRGPLQGLRGGPGESPSSASVSWRRGAARRRSSSTCNSPASCSGLRRWRSPLPSSTGDLPTQHRRPAVPDQK